MSGVLSVIIPLRDRAGTRVGNCLRSLRWQILDEPIEIVLSDFGSAPPFREAIEALATTWDCRVVRSDTRAVWNRARALNIGIRAARGPVVMCTDADMIFAPNFLSTALEARRQDDTALVICSCRDLPEEVRERDWTLGDFPELLARSHYRERLGTGACQLAPRAMFERVRGYDEGYRYWGCEDTDMLHRATRAGLTPTWIHDHTAMLHQWHPTMRHDRPVLKFLNDARFHLTKRIVVKNPWGWGRL